MLLTIISVGWHNPERCLSLYTHIIGTESSKVAVELTKLLTDDKEQRPQYWPLGHLGNNSTLFPIESLSLRPIRTSRGEG